MLGLLAQTSFTPTDIINVATSGGFAALAWYLLVRWIPAERKTYHDSLVEQQRRFEVTLLGEREHFREVLKIITDEFRDELRRHCNNDQDDN
jgi:hypothetical protein